MKKTLKTTKIKSWYKKVNPKDTDTIEEMTDATFEDVWNDTENVYDICGDVPSDVREVIFEKLSNIYGVDYDFVYNKWLSEKT